MAKVSFIKVESLGNDFAILENNGSMRVSPSRAVQICDRRVGVGADGLIILGPEAGDGIRFRLFNADGSGAEWSGNGVRGAAAYLKAMNPRRSEFHLQTLAGCIRVDVRRRRSGGVEASFSRPMPSVTVVASRLAKTVSGLLGRHLIVGPVFIDAGNPHWVLVVDNFDIDWEQVGRESQMLNRQTGGINVEFVRVISRKRLELRIFERGVGPTPSSGSGALAASAAARSMDFIDRSISVTSPGGAQKVRFSATDDSMTLTAPSRIVMAGVWSDGNVLEGRK